MSCQSHITISKVFRATISNRETAKTNLFTLERAIMTVRIVVVLADEALMPNALRRTTKFLSILADMCSQDWSSFRGLGRCFRI